MKDYTALLISGDIIYKGNDLKSLTKAINVHSQPNACMHFVVNDLTSNIIFHSKNKLYAYFHDKTSITMTLVFTPIHKCIGCVTVDIVYQGIRPTVATFSLIPCSNLLKGVKVICNECRRKTTNLMIPEGYKNVNRFTSAYDIYDYIRTIGWEQRIIFDVGIEATVNHIFGVIDYTIKKIP